MPDELRRVLLLVGENDGAEFVAHGLTHPSIRPVPANGDTLSAALAGGPYHLAVVGGYVGPRGPLILCEAVRLQHPTVPVLILLGEETGEAALQKHRERALDGVCYLDFRPWRSPDGDLAAVGRELRTQALGLLGLADDSESGASWRGRLDDAQREREASRPGAGGESSAEDTGVDVDFTEVIDVDGDEVSPPFLTHLTNEDLDFAQRLIERTRSIDFRSPLPRSVPSDAANAKTVKLRDRVRELENQTARLAFVYRSRKKKLDQYDETVAKLRQAELALEGAQRSYEHQVRQIREREFESRRELERTFNSAVVQVQQGLGDLRVQSAQTLEQLRNQLGEKGTELDAVRGEHRTELEARERESTHLRAELDGLRKDLDGTIEQLRQSVGERERLMAQQAERERSLIEQSAEREREWLAAQQDVVAAKADVEARTGALNANVEAARQEIERLRAAEADARSTIDAVRRELTDARAASEVERERLQHALAAASDTLRTELARIEGGFAQERAHSQQQLEAARSELSALLRQTVAEQAQQQASFAAERQALEERLVTAEGAQRAQLDELSARFAKERGELQAQLGQELERARAEREKLEAHAGEQTTELERRAVQERKALQDQHAEERDAMMAERQRERETLQAERERERQTLQAERERERTTLQAEHRHELESVRTDATQQIETFRAEIDETRERHPRQLEQLETTWSEKTEKLKESAAIFRDALKEKETELAESKTELANLQKRLAERDEDVERLRNADRSIEGLDELTHQFEDGLAEVRVELGRQLERGVDTLRTQLAHQEASILALTVSGTSRADNASGPAAKPAHDDGPAAYQWLAARPERAAGAGLLAGIVLMLIVFAVMPDRHVGSPTTTTRASAAAGLSGDGHADAHSAGGADHGDGRPAPEAVANGEGAAGAGDGAHGATGEDADDTVGTEEAGDDAHGAKGEDAEGAPKGSGDGSGDSSGAGSGDSPQDGHGEAPASDADKETARKALRKTMFQAVAKKSWPEVISLGEQLRREFHLDWESELRIAEALEASGRTAEALSAFEAFVTHYPDNAFASDASVHVGSLLLDAGRAVEAKSHLERAAGSSNRKAAAKAKALLAKTN